MNRARLVRAYVRTQYVAQSGADLLIFRIGRPARSQQGLLRRQHGMRYGWALISAANPRSRQLPAAVNRRRANRLKKLLDARRLHFIGAVHRALDGHWPDEQACLVFDVSPRHAAMLARHFGQYALVTGNSRHAPRLCWT